MEWKKEEIWYHGSPFVLSELQEGSTITRDINIARIFSHKPTLVSCDENGAIYHNGNIEGYLYMIDEPIFESDIYPHPQTTMKPYVEWLINRPLKLTKISETRIDVGECLSAKEIHLLTGKSQNKL